MSHLNQNQTLLKSQTPALQKMIVSPVRGSVEVSITRRLLILVSGSTTTAKPASSGPRSSASRKIPARKIEVQPTKLEAVDDAFDPLGPLGADPTPAASSSISMDQGPTPPRKELNARTTRPVSATSPGFPTSDFEDTTLPVGRTKGPPPVQPQTPGASRQTQPSVSVEQAAKPTFEILVGDPHKVGDLTSSHIVYQVRTKVQLNVGMCMKYSLTLE